MYCLVCVFIVTLTNKSVREEHFGYSLLYRLELIIKFNIQLDVDNDCEYMNGCYSQS